MQKIYLLPGLGFDHRIFSNLALPDANVEHLNWQEPRHKEHFEDYAYRVSEAMDTTEENIVLIGHSLGGILAQEIAMSRPISKIILLSSIQSRKELPTNFRMVNWFGFHHVFTKKITFSTFSFWAKKHGYNTPEKQELFKSMVGQQSDNYLSWALKNLSIWQGTENLKTPVFQIHGDCDRTFPISLLEKTDYIIKGGTHMMVFDRAKEISEIIVKQL